MTVRLWDIEPTSGEYKAVRVWDAENGQLLRAPYVIDWSQIDVAFNGMFVCCVVFTHDGKRLVSAGLNSIQFWDAETGHSLDSPRPKNGVGVRPWLSVQMVNAWLRLVLEVGFNSGIPTTVNPGHAIRRAIRCG